jgi:trimethylamine corrinoid protein
MELAELIRDARQTILDADEDKALQIINTALADNMNILELVQEGFAMGNREIGDLFESGKLSLPELIFSTEVMKKVLEVVESLPGTSKETIRGKVLLATVDGDVHDIGKGMVASTMKSYGIEVIDIGREVPVDTIIEKAQEYGVDIIGTSALLTSTLKEQKKLEERLREMGIRDQFKTMVGGAPCTLRWANRIGADVYSEDAVEAAKKALELLKKK